VPELRFSARTHAELVRQVREWLASAESERTLADVVTDSADLTKDALRLIAAAAPAPLAESELVRRLTDLGYRATDSTRDSLVAGLDAVGAVSNGSLVKSARRAYSLNAKAAREVLKLLR
jgi:hypothetical protein